jgi:hypothetical protein
MVLARLRADEGTMQTGVVSDNVSSGDGGVQSAPYGTTYIRQVIG